MRMRICAAAGAAAALMIGAGCDTAGMREASTTRAGTTQVYSCENGYRFVARFEPERVWLFLPGRTLSLPQVPALSQSQYINGKIALRLRGENARLELGSDVHGDCRSQPPEIPWEDARLAGADFRGAGQDPSWSLEVNGGSAVFVEGATRLVFPQSSSRVQSSTAYEAESDGHRIRLDIDERECQDAAGVRFQLSVRLSVDGREYDGCGRNFR